MGRLHDQSESLFGISREQLIEICRVNRTTAMRWKAGTTRIPHAAAELVRLHLAGHLGPRAGSTWAGWLWGHDGLLYAPDLRRGFDPGDLRALHFLQQLRRHIERLHRAALQTERNGVVLDELLRPGR